MTSTPPREQQAAEPDVGELIEQLRCYGTGSVDSILLMRQTAKALTRLQAERDDYLADVIKLDAVVHVLGIEDSHEEPAEEVQRHMKRAETAEARVAKLEAVVEAIPEIKAEIEFWLITIEAHCTIIVDPGKTDNMTEHALCIRQDNVGKIRAALDRLGQQEKGGG